MSENIKCAECGNQFKTRRSLHAHIKAHKMYVGNYYVKNFPRHDLFTQELLPFKNYDAYSRADFKNKKNLYKWLGSISKDCASAYCEKVLDAHLKEKEMIFAPNHLYLLTHPRLPKIKYYTRGSIKKLSKDNDLKQIFVDSITECPNFDDIPNDLEMLQDTREQKPLHFENINTKEVKLDFGDYTLGGKGFSYVFVDRKSESDFKGTMSQGFERFCRELERAREFKSYLFIVVESDFKQIYANNDAMFKRKVNLTYTWENMRKMIASYSDVCQFVFTGSRENSELVIPYLLVNGQNFKNIDLQYFLEKFKCLG